MHDSGELLTHIPQEHRMHCMQHDSGWGKGSWGGREFDSCNSLMVPRQWRPEYSRSTAFPLQDMHYRDLDTDVCVHACTCTHVL